MRTISFTEHEYRYLKDLVENMLNPDTYLGTKFARDRHSNSEMFYLLNARQKLRQCERDNEKA